MSGFEIARPVNVRNQFPDWAEERFPLYMLYPTRHLPPAKLRAFVDILVSSTR